MNVSWIQRFTDGGGRAMERARTGVILHDYGDGILLVRPNDAPNDAPNTTVLFSPGHPANGGHGGLGPRQAPPAVRCQKKGPSSKKMERVKGIRKKGYRV